jgi:hypothetical protein
MPVTYAIGRALLDGPAQPLFQWMINAPVLALFGLDHYATSGALVLGPALGLVLGLALSALVRSFRTRMAQLEEGSERYRAYASRGWVKVLAFVFVGAGHGSLTYRELMERRVGNPIRIAGLAVAVLAVALLALIGRFAGGPIVTRALRAGLERANGATVDVRRADLDLGEGRLVVEGLAMADPKALSTDLLRAERVEADVSAADLLRKRVAIDRMVVVDAQHGAPRATPGRLTGTAPRPVETPPAEVVLPGAKDLEEYVRQAKEWKERLAQVRRWLERAAGDREEGATAETREETLKERLAREVRELGWGRVRATHLVDGAPTLLVRELVAETVRTEAMKDESLDLRGENLSTHPSLTSGATRITVTSSAGTLRVEVETGGATLGTGRVRLAVSGLSGDAVAAALVRADPPPISGGTVDAAADGTWSGGRVDLPLQVTVHDATVAIPGAPPHAVGTLTFPVAVKGPLDDPAIKVDGDALASALAQAGASELAKRLKGELAEELEGKLPGDAGEVVDDALKGLGGLLGGKKKKEGGS